MQKPGEFGPFKFLWKLKLEHDPKAATALTQPILLDRIIGFRGFKSIAFVGTQSETVHAIDIDFGDAAVEIPHQLLGQPAAGAERHRECPGGLTARVVAADGDRAGGCGRAVVVASAAAAGRAAASVSQAKARSRSRPPGQPRRRRRGRSRRTRRPCRRAGRRSRIRCRGCGQCARRAAAGGARRGGGGGCGGGPSCPERTPPTSSAATASFTRSTCRTVWTHAAGAVRAGEHARRRVVDREPA